MAKTSKVEDADVAGDTTVGDVQPITGEQFRAVIAEVNEAKSRASEISGEAGASVKHICDLHGLTPKAVKFVAGLTRMEDAPAQDVVRQVLVLGRLAGIFRQVSMLGDDVIEVMREIVEARDTGTDILPTDPETAGKGA